MPIGKSDDPAHRRRVAAGDVPGVSGGWLCLITEGDHRRGRDE